MTFDTIWPIDEPTWLWTHTLTFRDNAASAVEVDAEGRWTYADTAGTDVIGYLTAPNPREVDRAASRGIILDAVFLCAHDSGITDQSTVVAATGVPPWLVGTYTVSVVRPNPSHSRVLLTRLRDELPAHDPGTTVDTLITPPTVTGGA